MINENKNWSENDIKILKQLAAENKCTPCICKTLGRSESAVRNKASELNISLKPKDAKDCDEC